MAASRSLKTWAVVGVVVGVLALVGGPFVYINFVEKKAPRTLDVTTATIPSDTGGSAGRSGPTTSGAPVDPDGTWKVAGSGSGTLVGYRVKEVLFGQSTTAYGRTSAVTGSLTVSGAEATAATFTADLTTVASDQSRRDAQFQGRIMDTARFPHATFVLTTPIDFGTIPAPGKVATAQASGNLTLKGATRSVTFTVKVLRSGARLEASGQIPVRFADYGIDNPSLGGVTTQDHGILEFLLVLSKP